jgi:hypothetical protein
MKLYTTLTSPYGRMARIVRHEKGWRIAPRSSRCRLGALTIHITQ